MTAIRVRRRWWLGATVALAMLAAGSAYVAATRLAADEAPAGPVAGERSEAMVERGASLARAGNCAGCHTTAGGAPYAGGRGIETPFGTVYASNLTPDPTTGIGRWSLADLSRALRHGQSPDGRLLYPAFPYPSYTRLSREDTAALYAFLRTLAPVDQPNRPHALRFPYNTQAALAVWRGLFFRPERFEADRDRSAEWNRGKYLVQGLGHCTACHASRNALGGSREADAFAGGLMPGQKWYAPALTRPDEAGVQQWPVERIVQFLKTGTAGQATAAGPMAEVVYTSTQHLSEADLAAMATFLVALPTRPEAAAPVRPAASMTLQRGAAVYRAHCVACHGEQGQGAPGLYPALAGNRAVTLETPNNVIHMIRRGGFAPSTDGNPQPFGMPPFAQVLDTDDIAAVATFIRQSWRNQGREVTPLEVIGVP